MPKAFLSHSTKNKRLVLHVQKYLSQQFIEAWIDKNDISGGANLWETISAGLRQGGYFIPFLSKEFATSAWCLEELRKAYQYKIKDQVKIIPVRFVGDAENELDLNTAPQIIQDITDLRYVEIDTYNPQTGLQELANAIWKQELVKFYPVEIAEIGGQQLQVIRFEVTTDRLPSSFLQQWDIDPEKFIAQHDSDDKIIKPNIPVALFGKGPNWLFTYLSTPFKNLRDVFVYNSVSKDYICVHSPQKNLLGKVVKVN